MAQEYKNILVRMPNWLGDIVMATPVLTDLKNAFPEANITAMCQGAGGELLLNHPALNEIFSFSRPNEFLRRKAQRDLISRLRQGKYDLGILLTNSFSSAWWFYRGHIKERLGYPTDWRRCLLNNVVPLPKERGHEHLVITYKRLLAPLGIALSTTSPSLVVSEEERAQATTILKRFKLPQKAKIVGINPLAAYGPAKCWPQEHFKLLCEKLLKDPQVVIVFFGDRSGKKAIEALCRHFPSRVINLAGSTSLRELLALIEQCTLFITNDSGPMHIAAALKRPLLALFGSTSDLVTGPYNHGTVIHKRVACSPCFKRVCPIDFRCMKNLSVEEVYSAASSYL